MDSTKLKFERGLILALNNPRSFHLNFHWFSFFPIGFNHDLRSNTNDQTDSRGIFDHWQIIDEDPFDETSKVRQIINDIRKCKGLKEGIPPLENYCDKL